MIHQTSAEPDVRTWSAIPDKSTCEDMVCHAAATSLFSDGHGPPHLRNIQVWSFEEVDVLNPTAAQAIETGTEIGVTGDKGRNLIQLF